MQAFASFQEHVRLYPVGGLGSSGDASDVGRAAGNTSAISGGAAASGQAGKRWCMRRVVYCVQYEGPGQKRGSPQSVRLLGLTQCLKSNIPRPRPRGFWKGGVEALSTPPKGIGSTPSRHWWLA